MSAMRCPHCAGEIPSGSRFCGICGRGITPAVGGPEVAVEGGRWPPATSPFAPSVESQADSISLFEMPASRAARRARMALVLVLDAILAGAGVVMLMAYFDSRGEVRGRAAPADRGAAGQGAAQDPDRDRPATVDQASAPASGSEPGAAPPPDAGASAAPTPAGAKARPASTPAPARRPKPTPKQKSRPAPKDKPVIPDDGSRVDA